MKLQVLCLSTHPSFIILLYSTRIYEGFQSSTQTTLIRYSASFSRRGIILQEANPMSGVFQKINPPPPHRPASVYPPAFGAGGANTRWAERGWGVNTLADARHCSVLYICKYFVALASVYLRRPPCEEPWYYWRRGRGAWGRGGRGTPPGGAGGWSSPAGAAPPGSPAGWTGSAPARSGCWKKQVFYKSGLTI